MSTILQKLRKRAVSVENVMLGLIVAMIMAGGLYILFEWVRERDTRYRYQNHFHSIFTMTHEAAKKIGPSLRTIEIINMSAAMAEAHATLENPFAPYDIELFPGVQNGWVIERNSIIPYGGNLMNVAYSGFIGDMFPVRRAGFVLTWSDTNLYGQYNEAKARRLCRFLADGAPPGPNPETTSVSAFRPGPLGEEYQIGVNGCEEPEPTLVVLFKF